MCYRKRNANRKFQASANQLSQRKKGIDTFSSTQLIIKSVGTGPSNGTPHQEGVRCLEGRGLRQEVGRDRGLRKFFMHVKIMLRVT